MPVFEAFAIFIWLAGLFLVWVPTQTVPDYHPPAAPTPSPTATPSETPHD